MNLETSGLPIRKSSLKKPVEQIKPGDQVLCKDYLERGPATITCLTDNGETAFVYWGKFNKMEDRKYHTCGLDDLIKV